MKCQKLSVDNYAVEIVDIDDVTPSPENESLYGVIEMEKDEKMSDLIDSIRDNTLAEPILVTEDMYILSGHRRYFACEYLDFEEIPIRINRGVRREDNPDYLSLLAEYNPQRVYELERLLIVEELERPRFVSARNVLNLTCFLDRR